MTAPVFTFHSFSDGNGVQIIVKQDGRLIGRLLFDSFRDWAEFQRQYIPEACVLFGCDKKATGTVYDGTTEERLPACDDHRDDEGSEVLPEVAA